MSSTKDISISSPSPFPSQKPTIISKSDTDLSFKKLDLFPSNIISDHFNEKFPQEKQISDIPTFRKPFLYEMEIELEEVKKQVKSSIKEIEKKDEIIKHLQHQNNKVQVQKQKTNRKCWTLCKIITKKIIKKKYEDVFYFCLYLFLVPR